MTQRFLVVVLLVASCLTVIFLVVFNYYVGNCGGGDGCVVKPGTECDMVKPRLCGMLNNIFGGLIK
jgi:hypothetical protein